MLMMVGEAKQEDRELKTRLCYVLRGGRKGRNEMGRQAMEDKRRLFHGRDQSRRAHSLPQDGLDMSEKTSADTGCVRHPCLGPSPAALALCPLPLCYLLNLTMLWRVRPTFLSVLQCLLSC